MLWLVQGTAKRKHAFPKPVPDEIMRKLRSQLSGVIGHVGNHLALDIVPEAEKIYQDWYMKMERSVHAKRIDTYALRLMSLLTVNDLKIHIDVEAVQKVIALCDWQLEVRKLYDPIDADTIVAGMEQKIRRALNHKALKESPLKRQVNAYRSGLWIYEVAIKNLVKAKEIYFDRKKKNWRIVKDL